MTDLQAAVERLEKCPWCAGDGWIIEDRDLKLPTLYRAQCKMCGAGHGGFDTRAEAIAAWNRRTTVSRLPGREEIEAAILENLRAEEIYDGQDVELVCTGVPEATTAILALLSKAPEGGGSMGSIAPSPEPGDGR